MPVRAIIHAVYYYYGDLCAWMEVAIRCLPVSGEMYFNFHFCAFTFCYFRQPDTTEGIKRLCHYDDHLLNVLAQILNKIEWNRFSPFLWVNTRACSQHPFTHEHEHKYDRAIFFKNVCATCLWFVSASNWVTQHAPVIWKSHEKIRSRLSWVYL